jgi:hypothetical protein
MNKKILKLENKTNNLFIMHLTDLTRHGHSFFMKTKDKLLNALHKNNTKNLGSRCIDQNRLDILIPYFNKL